MCITQLHDEISEMDLKMKIKEMENSKLKEENKRMARHFIQKKSEEQGPHLLLKVWIHAL